MAIIKPSKKFIGSDMDSGGAGKYIRSDIRQVLFNKNSNKDGAYLYFLPGYKADANGNGVWFKVINLRDNFGDGFKDKYVVIDNDPVAHFERNFKLHFPDAAEVIETEENGRKQKKYPFYGRVTRRVLFNVAYTQELEKGAHILDLPAYNGANILMKWLEGKDNRGRERPCLNDPDRAIPVFVKLNEGTNGAPWEISPDPTDPAQLPKELCDTDYIYNLDDVHVQKTPNELIAKLKSMFTLDQFEVCMAGYPGYGGVGGVTAASTHNPIASASTTEASIVKTSKPAPSLKNIPKVSTKKSEDAVDDIDMSPVEVSNAANPMGGVSKEEAAAFLRTR
jgi:hypothetical protein